MERENTRKDRDRQGQADKGERDERMETDKERDRHTQKGERKSRERERIGTRRQEGRWRKRNGW